MRLSLKVASYLLSCLEKYIRYRLLYRTLSNYPITPWGKASLLINRIIVAPDGFEAITGIIEERPMLFLMGSVILEMLEN